MRTLLLFQSGFLISFSSLIDVTRNSRTMLNNSGKRGHPCLVPDIRGNVFSFSPLRTMFAIDFIIYGLCYVEVGSFYANFLKSFNINGCWILSKAFSASIEMIIWFLSFNLLIWYITLIDFYILKNPCIPGINPTWTCCLSFLMCCWILFGRILLRIFAFLSISDIGL